VVNITIRLSEVNTGEAVFVTRLTEDSFDFSAIAIFGNAKLEDQGPSHNFR
jgi:hypothetical protein